jgi:hypothetical protein
MKSVCPKKKGRKNMDKRYWNIANNFYHTADIPSCLNDDFCRPSPKDMNGGILTMAFIDMQPLESVYPLESAFCNGTLFPNLNKPFMGGKRR